MGPRDGDEPRDIGLFEQWMGMTPEEWEALGRSRDEEDVADVPARS